MIRVQLKVCVMHVRCSAVKFEAELGEQVSWYLGCWTVCSLQQVGLLEHVWQSDLVSCLLKR